MKAHYEIILKETEANVENLLANLVTDKNSKDYGGIINRVDKMIHPGTVIGSLLTILPHYVNTDSKYYNRDDIYNSVLIILDYIKKIQRPDGNFDLLISNFYSAPDTGFITQSLAYSYRIVEKYNHNEKCEKIRTELYEIIKKAGHGMVTGGFHTPNHRWVISAALAMAYNITGEVSFKEMVDKYLNEGIDCDENGEYTERSTGIYNAINDNALIILAEETGRTDLLQYVKNNLDMMFTYMEPDGSVFTQNSIRVDKGEGSTVHVFYPTSYYHLYLYMAYKLKDRRYAFMADQIFNNSYKYSKNVPNLLYLYMLEEELKVFEIDMLPVPTNYNIFYENSGIVRIRKENVSYTILKNNSNFLFITNGNIRCYMKICASFFAIAQFKAQEVIKKENGYRLVFKTQGNYRMPFEEKPQTSDWRKMDHSKRQLVNILDLVFYVDIYEKEDGLDLHIVSEGCDRVPVKLEFCFTPYSICEGESFVLTGEPGQSMVLKSGYISANKGNDTITIGPAFGLHNYASDMRGSEPQSENDYTVYFTDYTNIDKRVEIRVK